MAEKGGYKHFMLKEIYEQPRAVRDTILGRVGQETGASSWTRWTSRRRSSESSKSVTHHRLRHQLARGAGRQVHDREAGADSGGSGLRQRVPLSRSDRRSGDADGGDLAIGRDGGHAGGAARSQSKGLQDAGDLQRDRIDDHARGGGYDSDACRSGDRRGVDEGVYVAVDGAVPAGDVSGAGAQGR